MDSITHAVGGLLVASIAARRQMKFYPVLLTGALAANLPDVDAVLYLFNQRLYTEYHRAFTHNIFIVFFFAGLAALPAWVWVRERYGYFYLVGLFSLFTHLVLDVIGYWKVPLLFPFSPKDFSQGYIQYANYLVLFPLLVLAFTILFLRRKHLDLSSPSSSSSNRME